MAETAKCLPHPASSSAWAHSCTSFPNLPVVRCGHVTEFWPIARGCKTHTPFPGLAHKTPHVLS